MTREEVAQYIIDQGWKGFQMEQIKANYIIIEYHRLVNNIEEITIFISGINSNDYIHVNIPPKLYNYIAMKLLVFTKVGNV